MTEPTRQELQALGDTLLGKEVKVDCRECKDPASYYVMKDERPMPWYYCHSCVQWFKRLKHTAKFVLMLPGRSK